MGGSARPEDLSEPVWNRLIAGMPFVEDGETVVHLWSSTDPRYDKKETQGKYDRALKLTGPPLCQGFKDDFDEETRAICLACPLLDTIKTPLQGVENDDDGIVLLAQNLGVAVGSGSLIATWSCWSY